MATTFVEYTGDGQASKQFTFPSYQESDVKVRVDGVLKDTSTHYNITNYTTTGGGFVVFTSGNIPSSPANIRIYRDTNVDTAKATFTAGSSVKAADLNNNTTQLLYRAQEEQIPNLIHSYDIDDGAIETSKIKADAVTSAQIADGAVTSARIGGGAVTEAKLAASSVTTAKLAADSVTNAKIADDSIDSEHYVDGSIDTAHIADAQITTAKIADGAITGAKFGSNTITTSAVADAQITTAKLAADAVTNAKIADDSIDSEHYVDGSIDTAHIGNSQVTTAKIADSAVTGPKIAASSVSTIKIADSNVTGPKIAASSISTVKIADDAVTTTKIADAELKTLAGMQSATASKLADSTALTADIADLNQIDGMAKQTTITDDDTKFPTSGAVVDYVAAQLEPFGGFEAIANESSFPNTQPVSGVAISIADAGGMAVSSSGTASGATVGGTTVNISGIPSNFFSSTIDSGVRFIVTSTGSGQNYTYHKATLKEDDLLNLSGDINDFSERYRVGSTNPTSSLDSGDLFFNTGTGKLLVYNGTTSAWEEAQSVGNFFINTISSSSGTGGGSATPNGTAYRFTLSNAGTNAEQHIVSVDGVIQKPNSGSSQPSEGFAVSGADIIFGSAPVSGASIFVITIGSTVNIGTPSNNTVTSAILQNGSVTTAKIVDSAVTSAKIADGTIVNADINASAAIAGTKVSPNFGSQNITTTGTLNGSYATLNAVNPTLTFSDSDNNPDYTINVNSGIFKITDSTNSADKLTINSTGRFAINGLTNPQGIFNINTGSGTTIGNTLVLRRSGSNDYHGVTLSTGTTQDWSFGQNSLNAFEVYENGSASTTRLTILNGGNTGIGTRSPSEKLHVIGNIAVSGTVDGVDIAALNTTVSNITTDLVSDTSPQLGGTLDTNGQLISFGDSTGSTVNRLNFGAGNDLNIYHEGNHSYIRDSGTGSLILVGSNVTMQNAAMTANLFSATQGGSLALYHNGNRKLETTATGVFNDGKVGVNTSTTDKSDLLVNNATFSGSDFAYSNDRVAIQSAGDLKALAYTSTYDNGTYPGYGIIMVQGPSTSSYNVWAMCPDGPSKGSNLNLHYGGYGGSGSRPNIHAPTHNKFVFTSGGSFTPSSNGTGSLGTSGVRWGNIYTSDLSLSNEAIGGNDIDGTWGDWTIQEGESDLFLKNNRSGKKYKFNLTEVS